MSVRFSLRILMRSRLDVLLRSNQTKNLACDGKVAGR